MLPDFITKKGKEAGTHKVNIVYTVQSTFLKTVLYLRSVMNTMEV